MIKCNDIQVIWTYYSNTKEFIQIKILKISLSQSTITFERKVF